MSIRLIRQLLAALALMWMSGIATTANASLIDDGNYVTDTNTNFRWLKLNILNGYSFQSVQDGALGYTSDGWRFATGSELRILFESYVGVANGLYGNSPDGGARASSYFEGANRLVEVMGLNLGFNDPRASYNITSILGLHQIVIQGFYNDEDSGPLLGIAQVTAAISDSGSAVSYQSELPYGTWAISPEGFQPNLFGPYMSSFLVKPAPPLANVPEPSTIALIAMALLSLFGFGIMRRRADA